MRVLHVNDYQAGGGAEVLMQRTVAMLRERGVEAETFTADDVPGHRRTAIGYVDNRKARAALRTRIVACRPDVIHLHNVYHELSPGILAELSWLRGEGASVRGGAPTNACAFASSHAAPRVVMTAHDGHLACPNSGLVWFMAGRRFAADPEHLPRLGYVMARAWDHRGPAVAWLKLAQHVWNYRVRDRRRAIDCVICPSRFMESVLRPHGMRTVFIPHPIDVPAAAPVARPPKLQLVYAGRVEPEKGLAEFLAAWPAEVDATLVIVGEGAWRARCQAICRERGLADRVRFAGLQPPEETRRLIAHSHVLVLPSLVAENCPMSLLEALAAGTNMLTVDRGGMREIVHDSGVGFLMDPTDGWSVRAALLRVQEQHAAGTLNRFDVEDYLAERSPRRHVEQLLAVYEGHATRAIPVVRTGAPGSESRAT